MAVELVQLELARPQHCDLARFDFAHHLPIAVEQRQWISTDQNWKYSNMMLQLERQACEHYNFSWCRYLLVFLCEVGAW